PAHAAFRPSRVPAITCSLIAENGNSAMPATRIVVGGSAFSPVHDARMVRLPPGAAPAASAVALLITISPSLDRSRPRTIVQGGLGDSVPRDRALTPRHCAVS